MQGLTFLSVDRFSRGLGFLAHILGPPLGWGATVFRLNVFRDRDFHVDTAERSFIHMEDPLSFPGDHQPNRISVRFG